MNAKQVVEYICEVLNIQTSNPLIVLDMVEDLKGIKDMQEFRTNIKSRIANLNDDYKYLSGYQKFIKVVNDYKYNDSNVKDEAIETYCRKLIDKIRTVSRAIDESLPSGLRYNDFAETATFDNFKSNGNCAFTEKEQRLLTEVGICKVWLLTFDDNDFLLKLMKAVSRLNQLHLAPPKEKTLTLEGINNRSKK